MDRDYLFDTELTDDELIVKYATIFDYYLNQEKENKEENSKEKQLVKDDFTRTTR